jgi:2-succinyl-5-enolpyruvyl-6-hydroxy-3-cyclohexene-1-carboxylate synthase
VNPSTRLARAVVDGLLVAGVRHAVLAPGSRSAPIAYELSAAERAGRLTLHVRVDERVAGFLALGLARLSRVPAAVVTTSGTAVANLHPAVLEAHHGLTPLVVVSADRPAEMRGVGANQATVQPGIFGAVTRFDAELDPREGTPRAWTEVTRSAVQASRGATGTPQAVARPPGPVHLDVAFREPLVPELTDLPRPDWPSPDGDRAEVPGSPVTTVTTVTRWPERTLVVVGDLPEPGQARRVARWAAAQGWPVVAEPFGEQPLGETVIPHGPLLLGTSWYARHPPEHILAAGRVTLSRSVRAALTADPARVSYLRAGPRWLGPSFSVAEVLDLDEAVGDPVAEARPPAPGGWLELWRLAGDALRHEVPSCASWGTGIALARAVAQALPAGSTLVLGSSNAVRDVELGVDWASRGPLRVVANRGLAGIDGVVSTAVGVALASGSPTCALVGDLTFLHDVNALLIGPDEPRPDLTVVVANDDGGGIFSTLEPGEPERAAHFERVFGTATGARVEHLARAYGVRYARADSAQRVAAELARPSSGLRVLEVPVDRGSHRAVRARLRGRAEVATAGSPGRPST